MSVKRVGISLEDDGSYTIRLEIPEITCTARMRTCPDGAPEGLALQMARNVAKAMALGFDYGVLAGRDAELIEADRSLWPLVSVERRQAWSERMEREEHPRVTEWIERY